MRPNLHFTNFLVSNRENSIFTFSPSLDKCKQRFNEVIKETIKFAGLEPKIWTDGDSAKEILEKVYEGINKSRILLFDLSKDERYNGVNPNVAYELGVARSIRDDNDILVITDINDIEKDIFFDIRGLNIKKIDNTFNKNIFYETLKSTLKNQEYYEDKRIESISRLVDGEGIHLMYRKGVIPKIYNSHFNDRYIPSGINVSLPEFKVTCLRLLDLGIVETKYDCHESGFFYAYHWTSLGKAIMKYMGIKEMSKEEFEKSPLYQEYLQEEEAYEKDKAELFKR